MMHLLTPLEQNLFISDSDFHLPHYKDLLNRIMKTASQRQGLVLPVRNCHRQEKSQFKPGLMKIEKIPISPPYFLLLVNSLIMI